MVKVLQTSVAAILVALAANAGYQTLNQSAVALTAKSGDCRSVETAHHPCPKPTPEPKPTKEPK